MTGFADAVQRVLHFLGRESPIPARGEQGQCGGPARRDAVVTRRRAADAPQLRPLVVFRSAIYVVGRSTTFGDSHGATGSTVVERDRPKPL